MSVSLEQLTQILAKVGISSSLEEEILTAVENLITPPTTNDETTYKEPIHLMTNNHASRRSRRITRSCDMI
jgi:hypothetical protein